MVGFEPGADLGSEARVSSCQFKRFAIVPEMAARRRRADADEQLKREPIAQKCAVQMDALDS